LSVLTVVLLGSLYGFICPSLAQTNEEIVDQFFPEFLIEDSEERQGRGGPRPFRASDFAVADLDGTGEEFIVAAYTNGFAAGIRVLRREGTTTLLVDEPALRLLVGIFPSVELVDLDHDGLPEVVASFSSATGRLAHWVFKWNGATLDLIGPSAVDEHGDVSTLLGEPVFTDLDGDGVLEIINPPQLGPLAPGETERELGPSEIFSFDGERYVFSRSVDDLDCEFADMNNDGVVNILDVSLLASCFGQDPATNLQCGVADLNADGDIDVDDLKLVTANFGKTCW
jgi:hypothetical protein